MKLGTTLELSGYGIHCMYGGNGRWTNWITENKTLLRWISMFLTSIVMRPKGSPLAVISKNTFGKLILFVGDFGFVEYDKNEVNPVAYNCLCVKVYENCRQLNQRNVVVVAIVVRIFEVMELNDAMNVQRQWKHVDDWSHPSVSPTYWHYSVGLTRYIGLIRVIVRQYRVLLIVTIKDVLGDSS